LSDDDASSKMFLRRNNTFLPFSIKAILKICGIFQNNNNEKNKVNLTLYQAVEAHRVVRRRGSHIF
jgi:hypothetical protein